MIVALQQVQNRVAEARGELPADTELTVERLTPAVFPVFILSLTGSLPTAELNDYALYVMRPALARVPGAGAIEVLASDTREIEVVLDPLKLNCGRSHRHRRVGKAENAEPAAAGRAGSPIRD